jgi:predicted RNA-binding protein with RPS1 domain
MLRIAIKYGMEKVMNVQAANTITNNEILVGTVLRPYIAREQLLGAVLAFEGKSETALLHVKQVAGDDPSARLSNFSIGEEVRVKVSIATEGGMRKLRASEKELVTDQDIVNKLNSLPKSHVFAGSVVNVASYGVFVCLAANGKKGLVHNKNFVGNGSGMSLRAFGELVPGKEVFVRMLDEAKLDDAGTLRLNLAFCASPEEVVAA